MTQRWDPRRYAREAGFVAAYGEALVEWLDPRPGERVLDLGCGDGTLSLKLVERGARVLGWDASPEQVAAARAKGLEVVCAPAAELDEVERYDAVFSNAALHWMRDLDAVLVAACRALKPGGRLVAEMGGAGNVFQVRQALSVALAQRGLDAARLDPWVFPRERDMARRLVAAGFAVRRIARFPRPTPLPGDLGAWLEVFAGPFLAPLDAAGSAEVIAQVESMLRPRLYRPGRGWLLDYVRLRWEARVAPPRASRPGAG